MSTLQVFSQWPEALMLVGKALDVQQPRILGVPMLGGTQAPRRALRAFHEDPEARVVLLAMRAHNSGLTLVRGTLSIPCCT
jgi:hypothetical protein